MARSRSVGPTGVHPELHPKFTLPSKAPAGPPGSWRPGQSKSMPASPYIAAWKMRSMTTTSCLPRPTHSCMQVQSCHVFCTRSGERRRTCFLGIRILRPQGFSMPAARPFWGKQLTATFTRCFILGKAAQRRFHLKQPFASSWGQQLTPLPPEGRLGVSNSVPLPPAKTNCKHSSSPCLLECSAVQSSQHNTCSNHSLPNSNIGNVHTVTDGLLCHMPWQVKSACHPVLPSQNWIGRKTHHGQ